MLEGTCKVLTATGYKAVSTLVSDAAIFDAAGLKHNRTHKLSIPQLLAAQATRLLTMKDGNTMIVAATQEFLVMTDVMKNITAWKAASAIAADDKMVRIVSDHRPNIDVTPTPKVTDNRAFELVEVAASAAAPSTPDDVYGFAAIGAPLNAMIVNGYVARMDGALLSTFVAGDDTPAVNDTVVCTLTLKAPVPNEGEGIGSVWFAISDLNGRVTRTASNLRVREGNLTGTISMIANAAGAETVTVDYINDGVAESIDEVLTIS